jgi:DNA-binding transcriptional LysR family regulator
MMQTDIDALARDTRLLTLFEELYNGRSMTRAAEKLRLSQPTVSIWVGKLRHQFGDPLFVRTAGGVRATPRADALIGPVREVLASLRRLSGEAPTFDAARAVRVFRIAMTDASHVTLLPLLLARIRASAPEVGIEILPISPHTRRDLEEGRAELAIGNIAGLESGFHEQRLYDQDFVCLVSSNHPRIRGDTMTVRAYLQEAHIGVLSGASYSSLTASLAVQHLKRRVLLELPGFLGVAKIVATTDLVVTLPRHIGATLAEGRSLRLVRCPVKIAGFAVKLFWHERVHRDPGHRWLRALCLELLGRGTPPATRLKVNG